jgi:hypothetical protein
VILPKELKSKENSSNIFIEWFRYNFI